MPGTEGRGVAAVSERVELKEAMAFLCVGTLLGELEDLKIPYKIRQEGEQAVLSIQIAGSLENLMEYIGRPM